MTTPTEPADQTDPCDAGEPSETQLRNFEERSAQLAAVEPRLADVGEITVVDLTADRADDVLRFFDRDAFADNAGWASCYCLAHHVPGGETTPEWQSRTWQRNRAELAARIGAGTTTGTLAYAGGRLVGWCNASPRDQFPDDRLGSDDDRVGLVACFVITSAYRGHGVARKLLDGAIDQFRRRGFTAIEGRPRSNPSSEAASYRGPLALYLGAGFVPAGPPGDPDSIVRLSL